MARNLGRIPVQSPSTVFLIRPAQFRFNSETAATNRFQKVDKATGSWRDAAQSEFDNVVRMLQDNGVDVVVFPDTDDPAKPDAVFPNNWVSCHHTGDIILYPLLSRTRRLERRQDIVASLQKKFKVTRILDLSYLEEEGVFLEGTGSVVFDYQHRVAYAALSERTSVRGLEILAEHLGYHVETFTAKDASGVAIYHTNVILSICTDYVVVCAEAIPEEDRGRILEKLTRGAREVIQITLEQVGQFAGNCYEVITQPGRHRKLVISSRGWASLTSAQQESISARCKGVLSCSLDCIEDVGGGGIRCMMTGIFNPAQHDDDI